MSEPCPTCGALPCDQVNALPATPTQDTITARLGEPRIQTTELDPDDFAGILIRAAESEEFAASLHRTAMRDGLTDLDDVARWCEKKARAFRHVAAILSERATLKAELEEARGVLEPFALLADTFAMNAIVEICEPHFSNPSPHIAPFQTKHFRAARAYLAKEPNNGK